MHLPFPGLVSYSRDNASQKGDRKLPLSAATSDTLEILVKDNKAF